MKVKKLIEVFKPYTFHFYTNTGIDLGYWCYTNQNALEGIDFNLFESKIIYCQIQDMDVIKVIIEPYKEK